MANEESENAAANNLSDQLNKYEATPTQKQSLLQQLFNNRWTLQPGLSCELNGGSYMAFDNTNGRYFTSQGKKNTFSRPPLLKIEEIGEDNVYIQMDMFGSDFVERQLGERDVIAGRVELSIKRKGGGIIELTDKQTTIDFESLLKGIKRFQQKPPETYLSSICEN
jgi:hypothetical protein